MPAPVVSRFAQDTYGRLGPVADAAGGDEGRGWPLLVYVAALAQMFARVEQLARSTGDGAPPWSQIVDPDRAPVDVLPYTGLFVGSRPVPGQTEAQARSRIKSTDGFKRGTPAAIAAAVQPSLTGTQYVGIVERAGGNAYALQISTRSSETPDPATSQALALAAKPAGLILTFTVTAQVTWGEMETRNPVATWSNVEAQFATYADAEAVV